MPDLLAHYLASYLVARALIGSRRALLVAFVGLLPDVDAVFMVHRWVTHSIPIVLIASVPLLVLTLAYRRRYVGVVVVAVLIYMLHIVMDVFTGLTPILWPLAPAIGVVLEVNGVSNGESVVITPRVDVAVEPADFTRRDYIEGPIVAETGLMLAVVVAVASAVEYIARRLRHAQPMGVRLW